MQDSNIITTTPVRALRTFLFKNKELRQSSTVSGFADLVERAEVVITYVDAGTRAMSRELAEDIERLTGADASWLMLPVVPLSPIPCVNGLNLTHEYVRDRIEAESSELAATVGASVDNWVPEFLEGVKHLLVPEQVRTVDNLTKMVQASLTRAAVRDDYTLFHEIADLLAEHSHVREENDDDE